VTWLAGVPDLIELYVELSNWLQTCVPSMVLST